MYIGQQERKNRFKHESTDDTFSHMIVNSYQLVINKMSHSKVVMDALMIWEWIYKQDIEDTGFIHTTGDG